jgi:hypothetical protein
MHDVLLALSKNVSASWLIDDESLHKGEADHQVFYGASK